MKHQDKVRYARHIIIPEIGEKGQEMLLNSSALVIGAGGLGSSCLLYLASAGIGKIGIIDGDLVEESNLQRQIIHEEGDIGRSKVSSAKDSMLDINSSLKIETYEEKLTKENVDNLFLNYDIIIDGSDNYQTRFLVNDYCIKYKKPLVTAAILRFEGQISVFRPWKNENSPCYRCLYPDAPPDDAIPSCAENGIFSPLAGIMGTLQANQAVKLLAGIEEGLDNFIILINSKTMEIRKTKINKDPECNFC